MPCVYFFFSNYFVRLFYLNDNSIDGFDLTNTTSLLTPLQIPGCNLLCRMSLLSKYYVHTCVLAMYVIELYYNTLCIHNV